MKKIIILFGIMSLVSSNAFSFEEGRYECTSRAGKIKVEYKITRLSYGDINIPHLEVVKTIFKDVGRAKQIFVLKGMANQQISQLGKETLVLEAVKVTLGDDGTPVCLK